jgi:SNF2 family DNA or RNA helicase
LIQPAVISLWFGIKFSAGGLCGSLKLSPPPKVKYDTSNSSKIKVPSKLQTIVVDSNLLKKSEKRLKKGHKQIETDIENVSLQEAQSLTTSYNGPQRYLYHGGMVVNDTSLMGNMTRYFREMFPRMISSSQSDEIMLSIHHGHQISNHRSFENDYFILDALIGVDDAVVARTVFSKDARDALDYKQRKLAYQDRVAQTVVCFESLGHAAEDHVDGLKIELLEFQKQALKWAIEREQMPGGIQSFFWPKVSDAIPLYYNPLLHQFREDPPAVVRGGFLAQEMGLGKTVISLALILKNPAPANPPSGSPISMLETANPPPMAAAAAAAGGNNDIEIGWNKDLYKNTSGINKKRGSILCGGTLVVSDLI